MATIGSISVAFQADPSPVESAVSAINKSLSSLSEAVDDLREKLSGLSAVSVSVSVDRAEVAEASRELDTLREKASGASAQVAVTADSSQVEDLSTAMDELGGSVQSSGAQAVQARSSLASLVVTTARVAVGAQQAVARYRDFRDAFLASVQATTGINNSTAALRATLRGLAGDTDALRAVFGGLRAGLSGAVEGFLSVDNVNRLLQGTLGGVLRMFGMTDDAVRASIQVLSDVVTRQVAQAASHRLVQRSLQVLGSAYDEATNALARFLTQTSTGQAIASGLSRGLLVAVRAAVSFNAGIESTVASIQGFLTSGRLMGAVSAATGTAFDAVVSSATAFSRSLNILGNSAGTLGGRLSPIIAGAARLGGAFSGVAAAFTRAVPTIVSVGNALGTVLNVFNVVSSVAGKNKGLLDFTSAVAKTLALSTAMGAVAGAVGMATPGVVGMAGAWAGATGAVASFAAALPVTIALTTAMAVVTGKVTDALRGMGNSAEQLGNLSDRFGMPVKEIQKLKIAADNSGVALFSVVRAQQAFTQSAEKIKIGNLETSKTREAKAALDELKISAEDLKNMKSEEAFRKVGAAISAIPDAAKRTQLAMDLFGRTGPQILPLLKSIGQLDEDIARLGGTISDLDFERFSNVDDSFDRLATASGALSKSLAVPFTRMQEAFNNAMAEMTGGFAPLVGAVAEVIADISTPFAVLAEVVGRVVGTLLRVAAAFAKIATAFLPFSAFAATAEAAGDAFNALWGYVEGLVLRLEAFASAVQKAMRPTIEGFTKIGALISGVLNFFTRLVGLGDVFGNTASAVLAAAVAFGVLSVSTQTYTALMGIAAVRSVVSAVTTAAAWTAAAAGIGVALAAVAIGAIGFYVASVIAATATTIASCAAMHVAWLFGLGPIGLLVGGVELVGVALVALYATGSGIVEFFSGWGEGKEKIDAATASVDELAAAAEEAQKPKQSGFLQDMEALARVAGFSQEEIDATKEKMQEYALATAASVSEGMSSVTDSVGSALGFSQDEIDSFKDSAQKTLASFASSVGISIKFEAESTKIEEARIAIANARDGMASLQIRAAQFGQTGADAASASTQKFNELQQSFADGDITLDEFNTKSKEIEDNLGKSLDAIKKGSPEETLKKNLELFKSLDEAAKQAAKSARDIGAGVQIDDKFFPRSAETKARAKQYADEYSAALDDIKEKLATGGFQSELDARAKENQRAFDAKEITSEEFNRVKLEIDRTSAQEQAQIASEEVQREFDRKKVKLEADLSFADSIRKELDTAFLSPVEKFQKELQKIRDNPELTPDEKGLAEKNLRKQAREGLIGKTATEQFDERSRDIQQGVASGLISTIEAQAEAAKASDDLAKALGIPVDPTNALKASSLQLVDAFGKGKISAEDFAKGLAESRKTFLESLGIKERPEEGDQRRLDELNKRRGKPISEGGISEDEFQRGRKAIENDIVGQSAADRIAEQRARIDRGVASGAVDKDRGAAALRGLDRDRKQAAGLDLTAGEQMQAGVDKVNDAFGVAGKSLAEIQATLSAKEFAEYQEAIKKNADAAKAAVGVQKPAIDTLVESQKRLDQAVKDNVVSQGEAGEAARKLKDDFMSAIGVTKTPFEKFSGELDNIAAQFGMAGKPLDEVRASLAGNAEQLALFDRAVQESRDNLLSSLGINKSPEAILQEQMKKIDEAANASDPNKRISAAQAAQARAAATRQRNASLGAGEDVAGQLAERRAQIAESFGGGKDSAREAIALNKLEMDKRQAAGLDSTASQSLQAGVAKVNDAFGVTGKTMAEIQATLSPKEFAEYQDAIKKNADAVKESLGIERTPFDEFNEAQSKLKQALDDRVITEEEFAKGAQKAKDSLLQALGIPLDPVNQLRDRMNDLQEAFDNKAITEEEFARGQEEARRALIPGGEEESPVKRFERDMDAVNRAVEEGLISDEDGAQRRLNLQAQLQESLAPALDALKPDRRAVESSDVRSKAGVDTFFRILRGNDNPSLKAQLEIAKNTKVLAEAAKSPDAAPVVAQF